MFIFLLALGAQAASVPLPAAQRSNAEAVAGQWGGDHIRLEADEHGARVELDCASGKIEKPIVPDGRGHFQVTGTFVQEHPGPIRVGHEPKEQPASYSGSIEGNTMTLRIVLTDSQDPVGVYTLEHGSPGRVRKCQ